MSSDVLFETLNPPQRMLMGPGPINAYPRVHQALSQALIGQYDPVMTGYMNQVQSYTNCHAKFRWLTVLPP